MIDYSIFRKVSVAPENLASQGPWDLFLSGFTTATRVTRVFEAVRAEEKRWLLFPQYEIPAADLPTDVCVYSPAALNADEDVFFEDLLSELDFSSGRTCIDITGMLQPHLLFLLRYLSEVGVEEIDVLYSEPGFYRAKERTSFAGEAISDVRAVRGFEGSPHPAGKEILIVGAGYDAHLVSALCLRKEQARKILLIAFPSLKPEMYQESLLRISEASEGLGIELGDSGRTHFVPAYDPFETANVLRHIVEKERAELSSDLNIHLCPLATKAQALGFFLFHECELHAGSSSIYFPVTETHYPDTTKGVSRVWQYTIELEALRSWRRSREGEER